MRCISDAFSCHSYFEGSKVNGFPNFLQWRTQYHSYHILDSMSLSYYAKIPYYVIFSVFNYPDDFFHSATERNKPSSYHTISDWVVG